MFTEMFIMKKIVQDKEDIATLGVMTYDFSFFFASTHIFYFCAYSL